MHSMLQIGAYRPSTVLDFEVLEKYGLHQTMADTLPCWPMPKLPKGPVENG